MDYFVIGNEHYIAKEFKLAKECYENYIKNDSTNFTVWHNHGLTCIQLGLYEEALVSLEVPCSNKYAESFISKGVALRNLGRYKEALQSFAEAFVIDPDHSTAYSNYGNTLREFGQPDRAIDFLRIARKLKPNNPNFELNECVCHLMKGDFSEGWKLYEARWYYESDVSMKPNLPGVEWNGTQDLFGKKIMVYYEQGFGDCIQFSRYITLLQQLNPEEIIVVMRQQLMTLFKYNFPYVTLVEANAQIPPYHYHVALLALPQCFNTTIDNIPSPEPYISVGEDIIDEWKYRLGDKNKPRIGLLWSPNKAAYITRFRQIELEKILEIVNDRYEFISLSFESDDETKKLLTKYNVRDFHNYLAGFYNTAGLIKNLDLVISIDTVIPHLSASMGIPTWLLLSDYGCDWRWFLNRNDSPFYNSMRLFRQTHSSWNEVINSVKKELG